MSYEIKRRDVIAIKVEMLKSCVQPMLTTRLMRSANLQYRPFLSHTADMIAKGLLKKIEVTMNKVGNPKDERLRPLFETTPLGIQAIEAYEKAKEMGL